MASSPADTSTETVGFLSLPRDVIATHVLRPDFLPDPADLGRLRAVCKGLRDAVKETGREIKNLSNVEAAELGYLSLLKDRHSRGLLPDWPLLCAAAARNGDLEMLKALRADDCPWDARTCAYAAAGGHLAMVKWTWPNFDHDCPLCKWTCSYAAEGSHLETLKWAREQGCPWDDRTCTYAA
jgi:hypothetical protein